MRHLTNPTRGRVMLWWALAFSWYLFLPRAVVQQHGLHNIRVVGAIFWAVVLTALIVMAILTVRARRAVPPGAAP